MLLFVALPAGMILIIVGAPLAFTTIMPNRWYGFRIGKALEDESAWHHANRASGRGLLIAGALLILTALACVATQINPAIAAFITVIVGAIGIIGSVAAGFAAMHDKDFRT